MKNRYIPGIENEFPAENDAEEVINFREDRMFVWNKDSYCRIFYTEITWLEADRNYCCMHLKDQPKILLIHPLLSLEKGLSRDRFMRVHRSHMINLEHVDRLVGNTIYTGKQDFPVSPAYREDLLSRFRFLGKVKGLYKSKLVKNNK